MLPLPSPLLSRRCPTHHLVGPAQCRSSVASLPLLGVFGQARLAARHWNLLTRHGILLHTGKIASWSAHPDAKRVVHTRLFRSRDLCWVLGIVAASAPSSHGYHKQNLYNDEICHHRGRCWSVRALLPPASKLRGKLGDLSLLPIEL
ncbi:hypothetical protein RRG08_031464 [Elysia crispata]|uniref:Uncharacterized protein n=1 Tax=Elysia crispata TaxID=231223 RepID=A0AAE0ZN41_9GAST|nr:hypothetical protein RRG08_031464 [Elysia crispata]